MNLKKQPERLRKDPEGLAVRRSLPCAGLPLCRARCRAPADAVCRLERAARELAGNQPFKNTFDRRSHALARQKDNSWPALHVALTWSCGVRIGGAAQPVMIAVQIRVRVGASRLGGKGGGSSARWCCVRWGLGLLSTVKIKIPCIKRGWQDRWQVSSLRVCVRVRVCVIIARQLRRRTSSGGARMLKGGG